MMRGLPQTAQTCSVGGNLDPRQKPRIRGREFAFVRDAPMRRLSTDGTGVWQFPRGDVLRVMTEPTNQDARARGQVHGSSPSTLSSTTLLNNVSRPRMSRACAKCRPLSMSVHLREKTGDDAPVTCQQPSSSTRPPYASVTHNSRFSA